jgi:type II secretory pathway predicted ATPase ExeA
MYESYFLLSQRPFLAAPSADSYIATRSLEQSRQTLVRLIDRAEGPGLIIGPAGTGKSLLCHLLGRHFRPRFQVAYLAAARLSTRRALLQNILFELKLPYREMDESELRLSLLDHLESKPGGDGLLLIVDEAHTLPLRLLEEIRLLTNVVRDGQARVRLILAGGMALEERLTSPRLESFHQRIAARCYLQPLGRDETIYYLHEQIRRCGSSADTLFTADAQAAVHVATDGIPRLINQVCDHALMLAALGGHKQLDAAGIEEAWADLQQLPLPVREPPVLAAGALTASKSGSGGIIEFGQLSDFPTMVTGDAPELGAATVASLETISRTIDSLQSDEAIAGVIQGTAADDFSPATADGTEVELIFHAGHDPFGGHWDEEEVVIDRYALLEDAAIRKRRVITSEARALGAAVTAAGGLSGQPSAKFDPANDPLLPDEAATDAPRRAISLSSLDQDDRDIIVVEDARPAQQAATLARSKRPEYRQLFSTLRGK